MMTENLQPCPFCGGKAFIANSFDKFYVDAFHTKKCLVRPDTFLLSREKSIKKHIKAWNRRAS